MKHKPRQYRCRGCDQVGHDRRNCPAPDPAAVAARAREDAAQKAARKIGSYRKNPYATWSSAKKKAHQRRKRTWNKKSRTKWITVTPKQIREEGVIDLGLVTGSVLFVLTEVKLHVIHASDLPQLREATT